MIKINQLIKHKTEHYLAEISVPYAHKTDIDPDCPESVAILVGHRITVLTGRNQGETFWIKNSTLRGWYDIIEEAS